MNNFYVYAWTRPDTGAIFYVGKGRGKRDVALKSANHIFLKIVRKLRAGGLQPSVSRLHDCLSEDDAFRIERQEIAKYGRIDLGTGTLANFTDGGEGRSGSVMSDDQRAKHSEALTGIPRTAEWQNRISLGLRGNQNARGASRGAETLQRMSAAQTGKVISRETRDKISSSVSAVVRLQSIRSDNTAGYKGVSFSKGREKWQAGIVVGGKRRSLGRFTTKEEAARAYDKAAIAAWGLGNCYLNFPANYTEEGASIAS